MLANCYLELRMNFVPPPPPSAPTLWGEGGGREGGAGGREGGGAQSVANTKTAVRRLPDCSTNHERPESNYFRLDLTCPDTAFSYKPYRCIGQQSCCLGGENLVGSGK